MPETPDIPEELPLADVAAEATSPLSEGETPESAAPPPPPPPPHPPPQHYHNKTTSTSRTADVPETAKEHETMLDVHPAHHAASSWKEFFIHIATIVLGLLIAAPPPSTQSASVPSSTNHPNNVNEGSITSASSRKRARRSGADGRALPPSPGGHGGAGRAAGRARS